MELTAEDRAVAAQLGITESEFAAAKRCGAATSPAPSKPVRLAAPYGYPAQQAFGGMAMLSDVDRAVADQLSIPHEEFAAHKQRRGGR